MKKIRAIIVDDEPSAIETLRGMLSTFCPEVDILESANSVESGLLAVLHHHPDLVFLDIEIPPFSKGFDLLKMTPDRNFSVIFTTAYPEYAIQAINDAQPLGYLVKPYRVTDLVQVVKVAVQKMPVLVVEHPVPSVEQTEHLLKNQGIIIPDSRKGNIILHAKDIIYCQADGSTTDIFVLRTEKIEKITASFTLKEVENQLSAKIFCRTHHSFLVNLHAVLGFQKTGRNGVVFLPQGHKAYISVLKMEAFEEQFRSLLK